MSDQKTWKRRASVLAIALAVGTVMIAAGARAQEVPDRLQKQIRIMEKVLNEVLEESPNLLVHSATPSHGIYLGGFGALFTFEASLVDGFSWRNWNLGGRFDFGNLLGNIQIERDGDRIIIHTPDGDEDEVLVEVEDDEGNVDRKTIQDMRAESREREQLRYEDGKSEIIDTLIDYGETLTGLDNKEFIAVAVYLGKDTLFQKREISRLVIQIKSGDLRAHADGTLSRDRLRERVLVQEY